MATVGTLNNDVTDGSTLMTSAFGKVQELLIVTYNRLCDRVERFTRSHSLQRTSMRHTHIVEQSRLLCEDYIYCRLQGLYGRGQLYLQDTDSYNDDGSAVDDRLSEDLTDVSQEILEIGCQLELTYPSLYSDLPRQLSMPLRSQVAVRKALVCIGDCIFRGQPPIITWCRVVGLFAVTAAIARECVVNGNAHLIPTVVTTFTELVDRYLSTWIYKQGGWIKVAQQFRVNNKLVRSRLGTTALGATLGFMFWWTVTPSTL
jgi:hypothetical protein